jgi:uncharacterized membrane protein
VLSREHPIVIIAVTHVLLTLAVLPLARSVHGALPAVFWTSMGTAAVLAVSGNALLVHALRVGDLSLLAPINAYKAVLSLVLAAVLIGELPTAWGLAGVVLILVGSWVVIDRDPTGERGGSFARFAREPGVLLRVGRVLERALADAPLHAQRTLRREPRDRRFAERALHELDLHDFPARLARRLRVRRRRRREHARMIGSAPPLEKREHARFVVRPVIVTATAPAARAPARPNLQSSSRASSRCVQQVLGLRT